MHGPCSHGIEIRRLEAVVSFTSVQYTSIEKNGGAVPGLTDDGRWRSVMVRRGGCCRWASRDGLGIV
jgi:hypothetical protein